MKWINNLSVKASWTLVLVAFSGLVVVIGALGLFANHFGREAFTSLHERDMAQISNLDSAYSQLLRARIQMNRAAELIRTPSFDRPDPLIEEAQRLLDSASENFSQFTASDFEADQQALVDQLASTFQSFVNNNLNLQMMMLEERDISGFFSGESRVDDSSQHFVESAEAFLVLPPSGVTICLYALSRFHRYFLWRDCGSGHCVAGSGGSGMGRA
ncbi:hypothetical protein HORIV_43250 [Vreelandella olivaria]|uniref:Chemotaxis methyl-accepting receptor Tar-related ligand-binding domain-containing protein n=1 Tax=Vreelandella olivaria TaxID=390919 RepID=A0ABN5WY55_9GAMM|nr:hypothetical protein HORIV_43250 [Halomonas olivaria]